jgi:hypothetical protein
LAVASHTLKSDLVAVDTGAEPGFAFPGKFSLPPEGQAGKRSRSSSSPSPGSPSTQPNSAESLNDLCASGGWNEKAGTIERGRDAVTDPAIARREGVCIRAGLRFCQPRQLSERVSLDFAPADELRACS